MEKEITAAWKPGLESLFHADAQKVAEEIISIGDSATPQQILDKARGETTELHKCLEWDDGIAAEKYRLQQCRTVARCLVIHETIVEERPAIRFFFKPEQSSGYQQARTIVRNEDKYRSLLETALRELGAFRKKYHSLTELETVFEEIERLIKAS